MLKKAIDKSLEENDTEMFDVYKNKLLEVPQILEEVKKRYKSSELEIKG